MSGTPPRTVAAPFGPHDAGSPRAVDEHLSHLLPALWKALTRATRGSEQLPAIESQVSILRKIVDVGPMPPAQLAEELYLARPTISNLLRDLEASGLLSRVPSETDGRSVVVTPTEHGRSVLSSFRVGRVEVLADALADLTADERNVLEEALPVLDRLLSRLDSAADLLSDAERRPA